MKVRRVEVLLTKIGEVKSRSGRMKAGKGSHSSQQSHNNRQLEKGRSRHSDGALFTCI
jgi:hypothetical protein